jgi:hypothetical protein
VDQAYLLQFAGSAIAIAVLAAVAFWARIPRKTGPLTEASARDLIAEELPDFAPEKVWVDASGDTAVARAGETGIVLFRVGDSYTARTAPWTQVKSAARVKDSAVIRLDDPACPRASFRLAGEGAPFA